MAIITNRPRPPSRIDLGSEVDYGSGVYGVFNHCVLIGNLWSGTVIDDPQFAVTDQTVLDIAGRSGHLQFLMIACRNNHASEAIEFSIRLTIDGSAALNEVNINCPAQKDIGYIPVGSILVDSGDQKISSMTLDRMLIFSNSIRIETSCTSFSQTLTQRLALTWKMRFS